MNMNDLLNQALASFYAVYNAVGYGFDHQVYINALQIELERLGFSAESGRCFDILYRGEPVGKASCDLILETSIVISVHARDILSDAEVLRFENLVSSLPCSAGLLMNFGVSPELVRKFNTENSGLRDSGAICA